MSIFNNNAKHTPSKGYLARDVGPQLNIFQLNIESISSENSSYLTHLLQKLKADIILLQETHVPNENLAKQYIPPQGYRHEYIPCWNKVSDNLYKEFQINGQAEVSDKLLASLVSGQMKRWTETMERLDFKHSSREMWTLLRRLDPNPSHGKRTPVIKLNDFANLTV